MKGKPMGKLWAHPCAGAMLNKVWGEHRVWLLTQPFTHVYALAHGYVGQVAIASKGGSLRP